MRPRRRCARRTQLIKARVPKLEIDGEMMADTAWDEELRHRIFPNTTLKGRANLYVMPNLDAANITYNMVRVMTDGVAIGPILMGLDQPAHILTPASTAAPRGQHDRDRRGRCADPQGPARERPGDGSGDAGRVRESRCVALRRSGLQPRAFLTTASHSRSGHARRVDGRDLHRSS